MPSVNEILQGLVGMQQNAQAAVPVIPNNGNPQGANNMPAATAAPNVPGANKYPWLNPSPYMDAIKQMLQRPLMGGQAPAEPPRVHPYQQPVLPMQHNGGVVGPRPVLPEGRRPRPIPLVAR